MQTINASVGVFRKADGVRVAAFSLNALMSQGAFGNLCDTSNVGRAVTLYDSFEDRWIVSRREIRDAASPGLPAFQYGRKIADDQIVTGQVGRARGRRPPAYALLHASWKLADERAAISHRVEIVEHLRAVMLDLGQQDLFKALSGQSVVAGPKSLQRLVVAIRIEGVCITREYGQQDVRGRVSRIEKRAQAFAETAIAGERTMGPEASRQSVVLKQPHD